MAPNQSILDMVQAHFREMVEKEQLLSAKVTVLARPLTPEEAIGTPGRRDFPIITGKERVIEASVCGARGQAFTDSAREFTGTLGEVVEFGLTTNDRQAIFLAAFNAVLRHLQLVKGTIHCRNNDPEKCACEIADHIKQRNGVQTVGLIGLNPAIAEKLIEVFGPEHVHITDLDRENIGTNRFGVEIWDGNTRTEELIRVSDAILCTGTTLVNGTFEAIHISMEHSNKDFIVYGVTAAGVCAFAGVERMCPYGRDE